MTPEGGPEPRGERQECGPNRDSSPDFSKNGYGKEMVSESLMHKMFMGLCFIPQSLESVGSCNISFSHLTAIQAQVGGAM